MATTKSASSRPPAVVAAPARDVMVKGKWRATRDEHGSFKTRVRRSDELVETLHSKEHNTKNVSVYFRTFKSSLPHLSEEIKRKPFRAVLVHKLAEDLEVDQSKLVQSLGLARSTLSYKVQHKKDLTPNEAERLVGVYRLIGQVEAMVKESGDPEGFDAGKWFGEWMEQPLPALGGKRPAEYLDNGMGRELVSNLLYQIQSGAFA